MGFKITRDFIKEEDEKGAVGTVSIRQTGFNAFFMSEEEQEQCEYHDGKIKVRLKDSDGNIYYHALVDDDSFSCELLLEWGMSYAGATDLDIHMQSAKEIYKKINVEEHFSRLITKDGRWIAHMG